MTARFKLTLEGVPYDIEQKGELLLVNGLEFPWKADGKAVQVGGSAYAVELKNGTATVDGISYPIQVVGLDEPKGKKGRAARPMPRDEAGAVTAIMPGLIVKILKKEGDAVAAGEVVLILEAMKMRNELHAKQAGVVRKIAVREGESVEIRQILAVIA
jgi:biotin carboxyl carrier protein